MGSTVSAPPPIDYRVKRAMRVFDLPMNKIEELWAMFRLHDQDDSGYLTKEVFFNKVLQYRPTCLTDKMFQLIDSKSDLSITFGEFVEVIATFSCFEKKELLKFFFYILDPLRTGCISKTELKHFVHGMWEAEENKNVVEGLRFLERIDDGDGVYNFHQVLLMESHYSFTFYPLYKLQISTMANTLGLRWWESHKTTLEEKKDALRQVELKRLQEKEKAEEQEKEIVSEEMIRHRLGYFQYHFMPWRRGVCKARILRIVAIEREIDEIIDGNHID